jgi:hypothetical protein
MARDTPAVLRPALRCVACRTLISVLLQLRSINFWRFLTAARSSSCAALKIRCRNRRTLSSCSRQSTASHSYVTSSGPFTIRCPTCPSVPADQTASLQRLTCPRQRPFRSPGTKPGIRPVIQERPPAGAALTLPVSCRLSPTGIRFLDILFPPEDSALLTVGLPDRPQTSPDSVGVSVFRTHETRPGWVPSLLRGGGVLPTSAASLIGACRFTTASPIPRWNLPPAKLLITEHTKIHLRSPVRPSPRPSPPGGTGTLRLSSGLRTPRSPTAHARVETVHRTLDRITPPSTDLQPV